MTIRVVKWNPDKYRVKQGFTDLQNSVSGEEWSVSRGTQAGDTVFIGCSGRNAAIFAKVEALSDAYLGPTDNDPNWIDRKGGQKPRWIARVRFAKGSWPGIPETVLQGGPLNKVANCLHRQGTLNLSAAEAQALDALL